MLCVSNRVRPRASTQGSRKHRSDHLARCGHGQCHCGLWTRLARKGVPTCCQRRPTQHAALGWGARLPLISVNVPSRCTFRLAVLGLRARLPYDESACYGAAMCGPVDVLR